MDVVDFPILIMGGKGAKNDEKGKTDVQTSKIHTSLIMFPLPTGLLLSPLARGTPANGPPFFFMGLDGERMSVNSRLESGRPVHRTRRAGNESKGDGRHLRGLNSQACPGLLGRT